MGGTQSNLNVYFDKKDVNYGVNNYEVKSSKKVFSKCINFEVVTHDLYIHKYPTYYDVYLYNCESHQYDNNYIFAYCSPSFEGQVLDKVNVYYSVLAPEDPLVISFNTRGGQWYNCTYSNLKSARWDYASNIIKYNFSESLTNEKLFKIYRSISFNKKIKFIIGKEKVVYISKYKQEIDNINFYRIIYTPTGKESVLSYDSLFDDKIKEIKPKCPKPESKPAETKPNGSTKYNNQIDPYYLTSVKDHFFDGIMVYFAINGNQGSSNGNNQAGSSSQGNGGTSNASGQGNSEKDEDNMIILWEFVDTYKVKTHIQRIDKHGYSWSEETVKYDNDKDLIEKLQEIKTSACTNESTTFILEKKEQYVGVEKVTHVVKDKTTYTMYEHKGTQSNKPNIIFRRQVIKKLGNVDLEFKTVSLDVYFLKTTTTTDEWPFILMFNNENTFKPPEPKEPKNKCYYFNNNYKFDDWKELKVSKKSEEKQQPKSEDEQDKKLQDKLNDKLKKLEENGKCQVDLYLLRSIAFYILNTDDVDPKKIEEIKDKRPPTLPFPIQPGMGRTLPFILGSVFGGVFAIGTLSAIIYGIYWYNTTIKLLT